MAIGDGISGQGRTTHHWTPEVRARIEQVRRRWPRVTANSYTCHPWCGWADVSVDFWGPAGRGDPLPSKTGPAIRRFLMTRQAGPPIRHTIWQHELWTSFGGYSYWPRSDHAGREQHLHVTYWP